MCQVLRVSEAGYYRWLRTRERPYKYDDLLAKIRQIRAENTDYGAYRIYLVLQLFHGYTGTYYVVLKLCKLHQLMLKKKYHAKGITKADPTAQASENLIQQYFSAAAPNQKWLGDITEIPTADGKLYLSAVLDCYDGAIVGFKMASHMRAELCVDAFTSVIQKHQAFGMLFHRDRGSQYTSKVYRETLARYGVVQSMSHTGRCYDNARIESLTLKMEVVKSMVFRFIEIHYNRKRIYMFLSSINWFLRDFGESNKMIASASTLFDTPSIQA